MYPDADALDRAAQMIATARRPVLLLGAECRGQAEAWWLRALAESVPAPAFTTDQAGDVLPAGHPLALGTLARGVIQEAVLGRADLVVAVGLEPTELPPAWPPQAPVAYLARAPCAGRSFTPAVEVTGEISDIVQELAPRLRGKTQANWDVAWLDRLKRQ